MNTDLILANITQHISLTDDEVDFFTSLLQPCLVKRREHITEGVERILSFATDGSWTGDTQSFWSQSPSQFNIEALEDSELIQIKKSDMERLFQRLSKFERFFRIVGIESLIAQQKRIRQSLACSARERYEDFRQDYPELEHRIPQKHIAAYLGITPEFLSTLRKRMTSL